MVLSSVGFVSAVAIHVHGVDLHVLIHRCSQTRRHFVSSNQWIHPWALWKHLWALAVMSESRPINLVHTTLYIDSICFHSPHNSKVGANNGAKTKSRSLSIESQTAIQAWRFFFCRRFCWFSVAAFINTKWRKNSSEYWNSASQSLCNVVGESENLWWSLWNFSCEFSYKTVALSSWSLLRALCPDFTPIKSLKSGWNKVSRTGVISSVRKRAAYVSVAYFPTLL